MKSAHSPYNPNHPQSVCALARASYFADLYHPRTKAQLAAHQRLVDAIRAGDLYQTVDAMQAASKSGLATAPWASWAEAWIGKTRRLILDEAEQRRTEP